MALNPDENANPYWAFSNNAKLSSNNLRLGLFALEYVKLSLLFILSNLNVLDNVIGWITGLLLYLFNKSFEIIPFKKLGELCKKYNKLLVVDNTFLTPIFQNPLDYNADIVLHSISKYINGHSDIIMGGLMMNNKELYDNLKYLQNSLGVIPSPFDCYMVNRSIKTLDIRMKKHQHNAIYIAKKLHKHPKILKVLYPGLDKNNIPCHMKGYGAMISLYIKCSSNKINNFIKKLEVIPLAESLGGIETLICHPASMTHASIPINEKNKIGITSNLLRLSVGIEDKNYILNDILNALEHI